MNLEPGTLWKKITERTQHALETGALMPIATKRMFMHDSGVDFLIRMISNIKHEAGQKDANPFLPYEDDMFVARISDTHVCLLNKFNVIHHHILIVTQAFEDQNILLTRRDFEAILTCMQEYQGLAFYNGGKIAGASQSHKHLQMIPLPMTDHGPTTPLDPLFLSVRSGGDPGVIPGIPFLHSFARLSPKLTKDFPKAAERLFRLYRHMLQLIGLNPSDSPEKDLQTGPYNLLFTRDWMLAIPRSKECFGPISINALGFAGALLVKDEKQLRLLEDQGGMAALKYTAVKRQ